jgi:4-hydroxy-2-oxoheptanedioate aldolase
MRPNTIKQLWREGKVAVGGWLSIPSTYTAEIMAHQDFDWVCVDTQHGMIDYTMGSMMLQAISTTDTMPFVRVPWNEPSIIMKYLDAGAYGVIVPMVNNRAEAERAVAACRYPPQGMRSYGPNRVNLYAGANYAAEANGEVACVVMIETAEALDNLDAILSTPGVDAAYIGPADLSLAIGLPPRGDNPDPKHRETVARIREACERHGVAPGIHCASSAFAAEKVAEGFKMVLLTSDAAGVSAHASRLLSEMRGAAPASGGGGNPYG